MSAATQTPRLRSSSARSIRIRDLHSCARSSARELFAPDEADAEHDAGSVTQREPAREQLVLPARVDIEREARADADKPVRQGERALHPVDEHRAATGLAVEEQLHLAVRVVLVE